MSGTVTKIASVLQFAYAAFLLVIGCVGVFTARWELATVFHVDPARWPAGAAPTMLNQYRFLKSIEFGAGLFCFGYRPAILAGGRASAIFLAIVGGGVFARSWSWGVDGRPTLLFIAFLLLEACVFVAVAIHLCLPHDR
ncbi:DUF4345 family protein [Acidisoma cellulosilytica]|uniref:DUF4345 family protein n=1 Tax=Acidisoma cellulosilyticum TaxID=2802395 RepID=A0A963Z5C7_9PROT|nr:DUF4345 family protein [Acidisoma cellulosilyticum]MCB8883072.1 DUF4345 family protein [Acidisoma cellulosilyticum]